MPSAFARIAFAASAAAFGAITFLWRDSDTWQWLRPVPTTLAMLVAGGLAVAQVIGGAGLAFARTAARASALLGAVYVVLVLARVPLVLTTPLDSGSYVDLFELLAVACGALAACPRTERAIRIAYGLCLVSFAAAQIEYFTYTASLVPRWLPPGQAFWTDLTTIAFGLAAIGVLVDRRARLAMRLTALMIALFGVLVWVPRVVARPTLANWSEISLNFLIAASAWFVGDAVSRSRTR